MKRRPRFLLVDPSGEITAAFLSVSDLTQHMEGAGLATRADLERLWWASPPDPIGPSGIHVIADAALWVHAPPPSSILRALVLALHRPGDSLVGVPFVAAELGDLEDDCTVH